MKLPMGIRELELGTELGILRDCNSLLGDSQALHARMVEDGYLLIRKLHDPSKIKGARRIVLDNLNQNNQIDQNYPLDSATIRAGARGSFMGGAKAVTHTPEFLNVVESPEVMSLFSYYLDAPAITYDYKWLRCVGHGDFTGAHYDVVYMGRGTHTLYTLWTPLGDVAYEQGPLTILHGSHRFDRIKETYGRMDVDRDHVTGSFSNDPLEMTNTYGGQWLSGEFEMGDALIFGMFTMHGSLNNTTNRFRLSCDTRYQRADEAVDERWIGENPIAHYAWMQGETVDMKDARKRWGV